MNRFIILLCMGICITACEKAVEAPIPPRPALVIKVGHTNGHQTSMVLVGEVKSRYESNQGFRIPGKIIERTVEVGAVVKKNQTLARIDPKDSELITQAAGADVLSAKASYDLAKTDVDRVRKLVQQKFMSQSALDAQEAQLKTAAARLKQVKAQSAISLNQSRYTTLNADRAGVVTQIKAEPGQVVKAGEVIAQIADLNQIEVLVAVPESRMGKVKINDIVGVKLWASQEKTYQGKVREITPAASEATRAFDMRVAVIDADEQVKLGMTAGVVFANEGESDIVVPNSAVTNRDGKNIVWVVDKNGIANPREVTITPFTEHGVGITNGLEMNELVAIAGVHTLVKGQKVIPTIQTREQ